MAVIRKSVDAFNRKDFDSVCDFYGDELERNSLLPQLQTLRAQLGTETPRIERLAYLRNLPSTAVDYFSDVFNLVKLFLVVLATNAVSGRSAFPLERPKRIFEQPCRNKD